MANLLWRRPPGWIFHALLVIPAVAMLWNASLPGNVLLLWVVTIEVVAVAAGVWVLRVLAFLVTQKRFSWWIVVAPAGAALLAALLLTSLPLQARFDLSRHALDKAATTHPTSSVPQRIGLYTFTSIDEDGDELIFNETHGCDFLCDAGFVYAPNGLRADTEMTVSHLSGPWWTFYRED